MPAVRTNEGGPSDAILPMIADPWMSQIVSGEKTYEFRKSRIRSSVKRIWFYLNAPYSHIRYVCEIDPPRTRNPGDEPLEEGPLGNREYNERHKDWSGYDYAYRIRSVYELRTPITLKMMRDKYGFKSAPRSIVFVKDDMKCDFPLDVQIQHRSGAIMDGTASVVA
ncbi:hypothetical protein CVT26_012567 [Gymnopilus dilepis]|uniref:ASCH domain-containing protein n=1 Tax=Gymnopilus dilepis TaxID=231916 RepID=A0A409WMW2_9AGAR|nr:hypothetical protein CVT26_012567 [Gymnopilus dilepis]